MTDDEMKAMMHGLSGVIAECQKFHPDFTDDIVLMVESKDQRATYYVIKLGVLKALVAHYLIGVDKL